MEKIRKILITVLFVLSCACFFVGCNGESQPQSKGDFDVLSVNYTIMVGETVSPIIEKIGNVDLDYKSYDNSIATVTDDGTITGIKVGTTYISISSEDKFIDCKVTVIADDEVLNLGCSELVLVLGSSYEFIVEQTKGGIPYGDSFNWSVDNSENCNFTPNKNKAMFVATNTGEFIVSVVGQVKSTQCKIKVVDKNAKRALIPELNVTGCKTLTWEEVEGASSYLIFINNKEVLIDGGTTLDISAETDKLRDGEKVVIRAKTLTDGNYSYIDSYVSVIEFEHDYKGEYSDGKVATCTQMGEITFICSDCNKTYTNSEYYEPHKYEEYRCTNCGEQYDKNVIIEWDDNYIPLPTDEESKFQLVFDEEYPTKLDETFKKENKDAWKVRYYDAWSTGYIKQGWEITGEYYNNWMMLWRHSNNNKDLIPQENRLGAYCVAGVIDDTVTELYAPGTYHTKEHGTGDVIYVKTFAFRNMIRLKKAVLSERIKELRGDVFWGDANLETVVMPGVSYLQNIYNTKDFNCDNFNNCYSLKEVVVGKGYVNSGRNFYAQSSKPREYTAQCNIFVYDETRVAVNVNNYSQPELNTFLTGSYYYYDSTALKCNAWSFINDKRDIELRLHDIYNGYCENCGSKDPKGVNYEYDNTHGGYFIVNNPDYNVGVYGSILQIPEVFDDGFNGEAPVIGVRANTFNSSTRGSYKGVTHILLPKNVTILEGSAFWRTEASYISIPGVTEIKATNSNNNQFLNCLNLKTLIVNENLDVSGQVFSTYNKGIDVYVLGDKSKVDLTGGNTTQNNAFSGNIYAYDATGTCNTWRYAEDGYSIIFAGEHNFINSKCEYCGVYDSKGVNYIYVENEGYYVTENRAYDASIYGTKIDILSEYDDGTNGKASVVGVKKASFKIADDGTGSYVGVTHIIFPESVTIIETEAFWRAKNAEYIAIPGVTSFPSGSSNQFLTCNNLKTIVVGENFKNNVSQAFVSGNTGNVDIYTVGSSADIDVYGTGVPNGDKLLSGNIYAYSATQPEDSLLTTTWRYDDNGYAILWSEYLKIK